MIILGFHCCQDLRGKLMIIICLLSHGKNAAIVLVQNSEKHCFALFWTTIFAYLNLRNL